MLLVVRGLVRVRINKRPSAHSEQLVIHTAKVLSTNLLQFPGEYNLPVPSGIEAYQRSVHRFKPFKGGRIGNTKILEVCSRHPFFKLLLTSNSRTRLFQTGPSGYDTSTLDLTIYLVIGSPTPPDIHQPLKSIRRYIFKPKAMQR